MTHLEPADVADFARGVATVDVRERVDQHLAAGCTACQASLAIMRHVSDLAQADECWEPPGDVVRLAKAIFPVRLPRRVGLRHRILAQLVFDSFSQPLPAGVRARQPQSRQVMYRAGDVFVDLRLDHTHGQPRVSLVGQIVSTGVPATSLDVFLMAGQEAIAHAPANEFGEFQLQYLPGPRMRLRIPLEGERGVDVPLTRLAHAQGQSRSTWHDTR
jgi:hypothetical protein